MTNKALDIELEKFKNARDTLIELFYDLKDKQHFAHCTPEFDQLQSKSDVVAKLLHDNYGW